jgi:hypothetical protein
MIQVASKYERRVDTRSYGDKKKLFEGVSFPFQAAFLTNNILYQHQGPFISLQHHVMNSSPSFSPYTLDLNTIITFF